MREFMLLIVYEIHGDNQTIKHGNDRHKSSFRIAKKGIRLKKPFF
jgi:hypothetical protein